jgi:vacuolar protein sorting-associated protein 54
MLVEFDKLKRDYQEHQNEIHAKLVAIMADRLAVHCSSLRVRIFQPFSRRDES